MQYTSLIKPPKSKTLKSGKVILSPGEEVGEHITNKREEIIIILKGNATLLIGDKKIGLNQGEHYYIKPETRHNVINNSSNILEYIYVVARIE